jgi:hypothetical protein
MGSDGVSQEGAARRELLLPHPMGHEAAGPYAVEAVRRDLQPQTPQACHGLEPQSAQAVAALGVLGAAGHLAIVQRQETVVGDGHTMGRACQGREDVLGLPERCRGVDHPRLVTHVCEQTWPRRVRGELPTATRAGELARCVELRQAREVESPQASREDADG